MKTCLHCGTPFEGERLTKKYCNDNCKQAAYFQRCKATESKSTDVTLTVTDVTKHLDNNHQRVSPTIQDIILEDISNKVAQLLSLQTTPGIVINQQDQNNPYKSIIILVPKQA